MYRDAQAQAQPGAAGAPQSGTPSGGADGNAAPKGDVVDAEFEDLGEKK
jgi:hypothetical protein